MKSSVCFTFAFLLSICAPFSGRTETLALSTFAGESLLSGQKIQISRVDETRKGLVVIFMSTKCPCSHSHIDMVKKLSVQHKDFRFLIIHSNADETKPEASAYFKTFSAPIEVLRDEKTKMADALRANKTPHAFVFNAKGEIVYRGGMTNSSNAASADRLYLAEVLQDLTEGKPARIHQERALGCAISRENEKKSF